VAFEGQEAADERAGLWRATPALLQQVGDLPVLAVDEDVEIVQRRRRDRQRAVGEVVRKPLPEAATSPIERRASREVVAGTHALYVPHPRAPGW
jgi:hypothetical protein